MLYVSVPDKHMTDKQARELNPLVLAFVGDSVQTLYVRTRLTYTNNGKSGVLHRLASAFVNATSQARAAEEIMPILNDDEQDIYRRARNNHAAHQAKHSTAIDYKKASGLEAVIGYLYLTGRGERLEEILNMACSPSGDE